MHPELSDWLSQSRQKFRQKVESDLEQKKRYADLRRHFELSCRRKFPTLPILWKNAHLGMIKVLCRTYSGKDLISLIDRFVQRVEYHPNGLNFDGFYAAVQRIATDMAAEKQRTITVSERKAIAEPQKPKDTDLEQFKQSAFFKRMPKLFKEKLNGDEPA